MLTIKRAKMEDAEEITKIKTVAFNKEETFSLAVRLKATE